jgi:nitrogen fixation protein FixH
MKTPPTVPAADGGRQFTGRHMLFAAVGFFGVIVSVNVLMAVAASSTWTGLVVPNSYVASQEFQDKADAAHRQRELGWRAALSITDGRIHLSVIDGAGEPAQLGGVTVQVNRPVGGHDDQRLQLEQSADGTYSAPLVLGRGVWEVRVIAPETAAGPFELHRRLTIEGSSNP